VPDDEQKPDDRKPEAGLPEAPGVPDGPEDKFHPEAIAARVQQLGQETDLERVAHDEEQKLLERKKKRGLESAASKRLAKIGEEKVKRPSAAGLSPDADPLLARAARANTWIKDHQGAFGGLVTVAVIGLAGFLGFTYWQDRRNGDASSLLAQALSDEHGQISDKADEDDDDSKAKPLYPTFKSAAERSAAAIAKYRAVESKYAGTGAAILARLAEASLLLDGGDAKGAITAYDEVRESPLGLADGAVRGRALEGIGFANELLAESDAPARAKHLDDALAAYQKLEQVDVNGFKELGMYHQARALQAKGDNAKAIELLKDVQKRVSEPGESHPFSYLKFVVEDRLRELDPTALPPKVRTEANGAGKQGGAVGPGGNHVDMNSPEIQKLLQQLKQKGGAPPAGPAQ
jgi:hypothetical protein